MNLLNPTTVQCAVAVICALHVLAVALWVYLVSTERIGTKTRWDTPPALTSRQQARLSKQVERKRDERDRAAREDDRLSSSEVNAALRRRRRRSSRENSVT